MRRGASFEAAEIAFLKKALKAGDVFWDIGANFGLYTVLAAKLVGADGSVCAIEPDPSNRQCLEANIERNSLTNVRILPFAMGAEEADVEFCSCSQGAYSGLKVTNVPGSVSKVQVKQTALDLLSAEPNWEQVSFLKMDTEGAELFVLQGGKRFFEDGPRPVTMIEFSDRSTCSFGYKSKEVREWLSERNYQWFELADNGLKPHEPREDYDYDNLIGCPCERVQEILGTQGE